MSSVWSFTQDGATRVKDAKAILFDPRRRVDYEVSSSLLRPRRGEPAGGRSERLLNHGGRHHLRLLFLFVHRHGHHGHAAAHRDAHAHQRGEGDDGEGGVNGLSGRHVELRFW